MYRSSGSMPACQYGNDIDSNMSCDGISGIAGAPLQLVDSWQRDLGPRMMGCTVLALYAAVDARHVIVR